MKKVGSNPSLGQMFFLSSADPIICAILCLLKKFIETLEPQPFVRESGVRSRQVSVARKLDRII